MKKIILRHKNPTIKTDQWNKDIFKNINIIEKLLVSIIKKDFKPIKIGNEREIATNMTEIEENYQRLLQQLYANKLNIQEEMDRFLEIWNLLRLNQKK